MASLLALLMFRRYDLWGTGSIPHHFFDRQHYLPPTTEVETTITRVRHCDARKSFIDCWLDGGSEADDECLIIVENKPALP